MFAWLLKHLVFFFHQRMLNLLLKNTTTRDSKDACWGQNRSHSPSLSMVSYEIFKYMNLYLWDATSWRFSRLTIPKIGLVGIFLRAGSPITVLLVVVSSLLITFTTTYFAYISIVRYHVSSLLLGPPVYGGQSLGNTSGQKAIDVVLFFSQLY